MRDYIRGGLVAVGAGGSVDVLSATNLDQMNQDSVLDLWLAASVDEMTVQLSITPPETSTQVVVKPGYPINVEAAEIDDEWDVVFRGLEVPKLATLSLQVSSVAAGSVLWKVQQKPAGRAVLLPPLTIDGGIVSVGGGATVDLLGGSVIGTSTALRRLAKPRAFSLLATADAAGCTISVTQTIDRESDIVSAGLPLNVRTEAIAVPKDRILRGADIENNATIACPVANGTSGAINVRWHAASISA